MCSFAALVVAGLGFHMPLSVRPNAHARSSVQLSAAGADDFVPDLQRRTVMNLVLVAGAAVPVAWLGGGFVYFFVPPGGGGGGAGLTAKDALGNDVIAKDWIAKNPYPGRALVQGLK